MKYGLKLLSVIFYGYIVIVLGIWGTIHPYIPAVYFRTIAQMPLELIINDMHGIVSTKYITL